MGELRDDIRVDVEAWRDGRYPLDDLLDRILILTRAAYLEAAAELVLAYDFSGRHYVADRIRALKSSSK